MNTVRSIQDDIQTLKKEKDICILAHAYQSQEIWEVADFVGDSYGLSLEAAKAAQKTVLLCGVRFMAETVKILSPQKKVLLSHPQAGCPMAQQISADQLLDLKKRYPDYTVAAYINTTSELKTICDVCVTSSSAVKIIRSLDNPKILFIPDCNLGAWVAAQVPEKNIQLVSGGCPAHANISPQQAEQMKKPARSLRPGRLCRQHNGDHGLCGKQPGYVFYYRNRKQHCRTSTVRLSRKTVLRVVRQLYLQQYEADNLDGRMALRKRHRRRRNPVAGSCNDAGQTLY